MYRREIWWANLPEPLGSEFGYRRTILIVQDDIFARQQLINQDFRIFTKLNIHGFYGAELLKPPDIHCIILRFDVLGLYYCAIHSTFIEV
ncbi:type II toxin-antitoxin system PemK/MazF family toxin [uncultured Nostoc sp.]|uniref:type II toxin-antitoxin system PemK/MazF family toxin n=1 Tax=uncultured Nostoc sp. TaxID=340711 RepID=UPI0035CC8D44